MSEYGAKEVQTVQEIRMNLTKLMTGAIATVIVVLALMATFQT